MNYEVSKEMSQRLLSDPENTIVSITNTLDFFDIKYVVAEVPKTAIGELPNVFIAQVSDDKSSNLIIVDKLSEKLRIQTNFKTHTDVDINTFNKNWTGFILVVEENIKKQTANKLPRDFRDYAIILGVVFGILFVYLTTYSLSKTLFSILSFLGVFLSVLILKEKTNSNNTASRFCSISHKSSCKSVLNSEYSKLFGVDLVDACIVYFAFTTMIIVFNPKSNIVLANALVSIPVIIYSIYQQFFKIKSWCPLCLAMSAILLLQIVVLWVNDYSFSFNNTEIIFSIFVLSLITGVWSYIKPYILLQTKNDTLTLENLKFRRNHYLFLPYFNQLPEVNMSDNTLGRISIGSNNPILRLTLITNPECKNCAKAHKLVMSLLEKFNDNLVIDFRFLVSLSNHKKREVRVLKRLLEIYDNQGKDVFKKSYNEWYELGKDKWLSEWFSNSDPIYNLQIEKHVSWCVNSNILSTPRVLVNNKLIPENYHIQDIEHLLEAVIMQEENNILNSNKIIHA